MQLQAFCSGYSTVLREITEGRFEIPLLNILALLSINVLLYSSFGRRFLNTFLCQSWHSRVLVVSYGILDFFCSFVRVMVFRISSFWSLASESLCANSSLLFSACSALARRSLSDFSYSSSCSRSEMVEFWQAFSLLRYSIWRSSSLSRFVST
jgi:hypothetical protein